MADEQVWTQFTKQHVLQADQYLGADDTTVAKTRLWLIDRPQLVFVHRPAQTALDLQPVLLPLR